MSEYNCPECEFGPTVTRGIIAHASQKHSGVTFPTNEMLLEDIKSVKNDISEVPTFRQMDEHGDFCPTTIHKRFGSWSSAVKEAGLEPRSTPTGKDSPQWTGGGTKFYKTKSGEAWRKAVFQRDEYTCQDCGDVTGGNLNAHHIKQREKYPDLELMVWNGVTLCRSCHAERHRGEDVYEMLEAKAKDLSGDSTN